MVVFAGQACRWGLNAVRLAAGVILLASFAVLVVGNEQGGGGLAPLLAAAAMAMSSVSVVTNALRLRRFSQPALDIVLHCR